jgi:hypothetical protein
MVGLYCWQADYGVFYTMGTIGRRGVIMFGLSSQPRIVSTFVYVSFHRWSHLKIHSRYQW